MTLNLDFEKCSDRIEQKSIHEILHYFNIRIDNKVLMLNINLRFFINIAYFWIKYILMIGFLNGKLKIVKIVNFITA